MDKLLKRLNNFEEHILAVLLPVMCITIFVATFLRFTNIFVITWAEELARYCMVWITYIGISAAAKKGEHFCVTVVDVFLPLALQKFFIVIRIVLMLAFTVFVVRYSFVILENQIGMKQISPSLKWPMWCLYAAIPLGTLLMAVRYTIHGTMKLLDKKEPEGGKK